MTCRLKLHTVFGVVTSRAGSRCTEHARQSNRSRHNAFYSTRAWQRLSARVLRAWRGEHGNWCPGYQRDAHAASDLTVDHIVPLAAGGAPFDIANTSVALGWLADGDRDAERVATGAGFRHAPVPGTATEIAPLAASVPVEPDPAAGVIRAGWTDDGRIGPGARQAAIVRAIRAS